MSTFSLVIGILITLALLVPVLAQEDGLVGEWHFDEGAGNVVKDSSGNGNDGTIYGATWIDGKFGKALSFDGVDDYVRVPDSPLWDFGTSDITVNFWFMKRDTNQGVALNFGLGRNNNLIFDFDDPDSGGKGVWIYWMGTGIPHVWTSDTYHDSKWHFLSFNRAGNIFKLYIDGNYIDGTTDSSNIQIIGDLNFGSHTGGSKPYFKGSIDEMRIYNRALSTEEIKFQYEQGPNALSLTKTASPNSIKQSQTTTITLTIKNTGSTEITDIEIADVIPKDLTLIDGETTKTYASLSPKDSRQFQYSVQINEAGTFNLGQATASYADNKGNYQTIKSKPASIEVIPSLITDSKQTPSRKSNSNAQSASVNLHGEKTDVALGENVLLKLSAVNIIGNPTMHVQVIIIPPSGWSVTSSEFAKSGAGQYTTTYNLESGGGKDIEVRIVPNQVGEDFQVEGRIVYYFGDDVATREDHTLKLPIKVRAKSNIEMTTVVPQSDKQSTPGFAFAVGVLGLVVAIQLIKRK